MPVWQYKSTTTIFFSFYNLQDVENHSPAYSSCNSSVCIMIAQKFLSGRPSLRNQNNWHKNEMPLLTQNNFKVSSSFSSKLKTSKMLSSPDKVWPSSLIRKQLAFLPSLHFGPFSSSSCSSFSASTPNLHFSKQVKRRFLKIWVKQHF